MTRSAAEWDATCLYKGALNVSVPLEAVPEPASSLLAIVAAAGVILAAPSISRLDVILDRQSVFETTANCPVRVAGAGEWDGGPSAATNNGGRRQQGEQGEHAARGLRHGTHVPAVARSYGGVSCPASGG